MKPFSLLLAPMLIVVAAGAAQADVRTACASDVKSYCSGVEPKGGKLRDCMAQNRAKLSNDCKLAVADRLLERQAKAADDRKSGKKSKVEDDE